MNDLHARMALSAQSEPGDEAVGAAVREFGAAQVVESLRAGSGADVGCEGLGRRWDQRLADRQVEQELAAAERRDVRLITPSDREWPTQLNDLCDGAPLMLRRIGPANVRLAAVASVAVVGARSCTRYGSTVAETLGADLAFAGQCVVSGGAFGIDASAHSGALAADGVSVAVSAGGVDRPIPRGNARIFDALESTGAVVSEVPIGSTPDRRHFLVRNRLIAALARVVVIVEAGRRSGARRTAGEAMRLGRIVAAVPGPVTSAASVGCHELLREQFAVLVRDAEDVMELLRPIGDLIEPCRSEQRIEGALSAAAGQEPMSVEDLAGACQMSLPDARGALLTLQARGRAHRRGSGWVCATTPT